MRKLALVVPSLIAGGGVPSVARFVRDAALRPKRFELKIVSLCMASHEHGSRMIRSPSSWLKDLQGTAGLWDGLPYTHVGANWAELEIQRYRPRQVLSDLLADCDLIQVISGSAAWANAVIGLGKPVSLLVATRAKIERRRRATGPQGFAGYWRKAMTELTDRLDDRALAQADAIQVMNPWMLEYAKEVNKGRSDVRYSPPGINAQRFRPLKDRPRGPHPYILCVGRLDDPRKNIGLLLKAFSLMAQSMTHIRLVTAGVCPPPTEYWARVDALGLRDRVRHVHRPDEAELVKLYQEASVFALSSDEEGFGVVILEAMACGIPVVATRSGGPDGIVTEGADGWLVPLDDATAMANRLSLLCQDPHLNKAMGLQARKTIEARYAEEVAAQELLAVWDRLLAKAEGR